MPSREEEINEINILKNWLNNFDNKKIDINNLIIYLCSNLRANNYRITNTNEQQTKMIVGRIVPAIASTTIMITGFACLQLLTLLNSDDISLVKNLNLYQINNPSDVLHMEDQEYNPLMDGSSIAVPKGWTVWNIINIK